ncbi:MAG TPA: carboxypeptidase regulatory-like domain-containing protein [Thermoanaerobaculia bacterium]|nr:carboxypeptidase regulatory-like domain-containing protein [Thermoanaerobaculia bacterium]
MKLNRFFAVFVVLLLAGLSAYGQMTANLTGTVRLGGNPLPGVTVTISSPNLQGTRTTTTDVNGNYNFGNLPPGAYTVKFEMESMRPVTRNLNVGISTTARADAEMKLSAVAESITVTASSPAVLETTEVQTNLTAKLVESLPTTRTLLATVNLAPGVTSNGVGGATVISGGPAYDSTYYVDGAVVNEVLRGQAQNLFIEDAIQETTVQTGAISAEYGRFTGGVVTAISKSGGNEFSGTFRDSMTNPPWTTRGSLDTGSRPKSNLSNVYEATLGGRLVRDRLWFFTAGRYRKRDLQSFFGTLPADPSFPGNGNSLVLSYPFSDTERRLEGKLTGQLSPKHTLVASYFDIKQDQRNNPFGTPLEASSLDKSRSLPNSFWTVNYNGIITNNFLVEGTYARQTFKFVNSGADGPAPPESGTNIDFPRIAAWAGFNTFCGGCPAGTESRNNYNGKIKGSYFLSTKGSGTHNFTLGYENYQDMLKANNYQSASNFTVFGYDPQDRAADGTFLATFNPGNALIIYFPILAPSKGNAFNTQSVFANDKWDFNSHLNLNLGFRYDKNAGENEAHATVAKDSRVSPRLGLIYDVWANGRLRLNASYSQYASKIANGNVGDATSPAGSPSYLYWIYYGPAITRQPTPAALTKMFAWFNSVGGINNTDFRLGGGAAGVSTQILGNLKSPGLDEYTFGAGGQVGPNGFLRADYQYRKWNDFYTTFANTATGKIFDPLAQANVDLGYITNGNDISRVYHAVLVQGAYKFFNRLNFGANYTYSTLKGNAVGETSGSGPVPTNSSQNYPEFYNYAQRNPTGFLAQDERNKIRAWLSYDLPTKFGNFNFSALERYDSGQPYSAIGSIYVSGDSGSRCTNATMTANGAIAAGFHPCPTAASTHTSYTNVSGFSTNNFYFSQRGAFRTDNLTATDLSINYFLPIQKAQLYFEGQVINTFNSQAATSVNTNIFTATSSACVQTTGAGTGTRCWAFNPFTDTPKEGVNWIKGPSFGKPLRPTSAATAGDFQLPRTYRFSFGAKF